MITNKLECGAGVWGGGGGVIRVLTEKVRQGVAVGCMSFVQLTFYFIK